MPMDVHTLHVRNIRNGRVRQLSADGTMLAFRAHSIKPIVHSNHNYSGRNPRGRYVPVGPRTASVIALLRSPWQFPFSYVPLCALELKLSFRVLVLSLSDLFSVNRARGA